MRLPPRADLLAPLGRLVEAHRLLHGWTQWQLASFCRLSMNSVGNLEAARHRTAPDSLIAILQSLRTEEDAASGVALPVLRAPTFRPTALAEEARRVLQTGGLLDYPALFVRTQDAGSWGLRCAKDDVTIAESQAPLRDLALELERGSGPRVEQMIVLGLGGGHQAPELVREALSRTALASVWLLDTSALLLHHTERAVGTVLDAALQGRRKKGRWGATLGVQPLCIDYRDIATVQRLFNTGRPFPFTRLIILGTSVLDHAADDWRDLGVAAALAEKPADLLLIEHRRTPGDNPADPIERALSDWLSVYLQEGVRWVSVKLSGAIRREQAVVEAQPAPSALNGVVAEDLVARIRGSDAQEREVRIRWRRAYDAGALDAWMAAHGLRLRGRWPYRYGSRCWALYERAPLEEHP